MGNFKRMHIIAGTMAIIFVFWLSPKWLKIIHEDLNRGIEVTAALAILGYILGCVFGLALNFFLMLFREK